MIRKISSSIFGLAAGIILMANSTSAASYVVQPDDSLWKISQRHYISVQQLKKLNPQVGEMIYPNQILSVPGMQTHTIQNNETLWEISLAYSVQLEELIRVNPQIASPNIVWSGMVIHLPEGASTRRIVSPPPHFADGIFPLKKGTYEPLINNFGEQRYWHESGYATRKHEGVDLFAAKGTPVYSASDGKIINIGWNSYGGWRVTIKANDTTAFYYAHLSKYAEGMSSAAYIKKGQLIGYVGSTGYGPEGTEGLFLPHLHFGMYQTNTSPWTAVDPYPYLNWWESSARTAN